MAARSRSVQRFASTGANLGFEKKLWEAADTLLGSMDAGAVVALAAAGWYARRRWLR